MSDEPKMRIFRAADGVEFNEAGCMTMTPSSEVQNAGFGKMLAAGLADGEEIKVLVSLPGFSLTHVWFKKDFPLPLHSHDADCVYYIVAGSLQLGTETLGPRDSFFVPANAAYTYSPGPEGAELLEIRNADQFDFRNLAKSAAFYDKAVGTIAANRADWKQAERPKVTG